MDDSHIRKKARIEIPLISKPRPYRKGDGPSIKDAPIQLVLQNDSTAYIVEKEAKYLPGGVKLQMHYLVRWTDLRAASLWIPATQIIDYVSPRVLEDFEYELSLERDALEEAQQRKKKSAGGQKIEVELSTKPAGPGKKRGRGVHPAPAAPGSPVPLPLAAPASATGPSLSTPQKSKISGDFATEDETEGEDDLNPEDAIFKQLHEDAERERDDSEEEHDTDELAGPSTNSFQLPPMIRTASKLQFPPKDDNHLSSEAKSPSTSKLPRSETLVQDALVSSALTPAGHSSEKWQKKNSSDVSKKKTPEVPYESAISNYPAPAWLQAGSPNTKSSPKSSSKKMSRKVILVEEDSGFEVKRLEGVKLIDDGNNRQRWFKVRWEGDWPPEENPTWEPEENLPENLVKKFLKKRKSKDKSKGKSSSLDLDEENHAGNFNRKYASVHEAFEDDGFVAQPLRQDSPRPDADVEDEERLLVEEGGDSNARAAPLATPVLHRNGSLASRSLNFAQAPGLFKRLSPTLPGQS